MMGYAEYLDKLYQDYVVWKQDYNEYNDALRQMLEVMQELYPGPYVLGEYYNRAKERFDVRLVFVDPAVEIMWRLKNA